MTSSYDGTPSTLQNYKWGPRTRAHRKKFSRWISYPLCNMCAPKHTGLRMRWGEVQFRFFLKLCPKQSYSYLQYRFIPRMMTSSNGNPFRVTGPLCREFTGHRWLPPQRPVTRSFDVFFDLRLNKWLSKQSQGWWFETRHLEHHYDVIVMEVCPESMLKDIFIPL